MKKILLAVLSIAFLLQTAPTAAQTAKEEAKLVQQLEDYFRKYKPKGTRLTQAPRMLEYQLNDTTRTLTIVADEFFAAQEFNPEITAHIYKIKR